MGQGFHSWHYSTVQATLTRDRVLAPICPNSGCGITLIDRQFLHQQRPGIQELPTPCGVTIRPVGNQPLRTNTYVAVDVYLPGHRPGSPNCVAKIYVKAYVVEHLAANVLLGSDTLGLYKMVINYRSHELLVGSCPGFRAPLRVITKGSAPNVRQVVKALETTTVPA